MDGRAHFILYVSDSARSAAFYAHVLDAAPRLDVPGMTEFLLPGGAILGLMPELGIRRLLGDRLPDPAGGRGIPRCEIYLVLDEPAQYHTRAIEAGGVELSPLFPRDWGDDAAYCLDPDGHVIAFACGSIEELPVDAEVEAFLAEAGLDASDLRTAPGLHLLGVRDSGRLVAVAGIEAHPPVGLLRSVAVRPSRRNTGLGRRLVMQAERWSLAHGIESLFLLTTTAAGFFGRLGYEEILRSEAPSAIAGTSQFAGLCPSSSTFMRRQIA